MTVALAPSPCAFKVDTLKRYSAPGWRLDTIALSCVAFTDREPSISSPTSPYVTQYCVTRPPVVGACQVSCTAVELRAWTWMLVGWPGRGRPGGDEYNYMLS